LQEEEEEEGHVYFILLELEKHITWPAFPSAMRFPHKLLLFFVVH
jgi:hypothetical protein